MSGLVLGVTGLPCVGKSLAASLLAAGRVEGVPEGRLFKADDIGHAVLERPEAREQLRRRFGDGVVRPDPADTRRRLAARAFANPEDLAWLEGLVHPLVVRELDELADAAGDGRSVVIEAALLTAAGLDRRCDAVFLIEAEFAVRLRRAAGRGWDRAELERRDARQLPLFAPEKLRALDEKVIWVRNDRDDDRLVESLRGAWAGHNTKHTGKEE